MVSLPALLMIAAIALLLGAAAHFVIGRFLPDDADPEPNDEPPSYVPVELPPSPDEIQFAPDPTDVRQDAIHCALMLHDYLKSIDQERQAKAVAKILPTLLESHP